MGYEKIRESVVRPLEGLKVAIHYGCHLLKPSRIMKVDDPNSFGEAAVAGDWSDKGVKLYLSEVAAPGNDLTDPADWDQAPLIVDSTGTVTNATTGTATLADDSRQASLAVTCEPASPALQ